jgi:hypothetical protein
VDAQVTWRGRPFTGASGQRKADKFETEGVNIRAHKPEKPISRGRTPSS